MDPGSEEYGAVRQAIGFAPGTAQTAFEGIRAGGGHAIRHLQQAGLVPRRGRLERQVEVFRRRVTPLLEHPMHSFDWRIGGIIGRGFAGKIDDRWVVVIVAKEGPYQGTVVSAFIPDANQMRLMGLQ